MPFATCERLGEIFSRKSKANQDLRSIPCSMRPRRSAIPSRVGNVREAGKIKEMGEVLERVTQINKSAHRSNADEFHSGSRRLGRLLEMRNEILDKIWKAGMRRLARFGQ